MLPVNLGLRNVEFDALDNPVLGEQSHGNSNFRCDMNSVNPIVRHRTVTTGSCKRESGWMSIYPSASFDTRLAGTQLRNLTAG